MNEVAIQEGLKEICNRISLVSSELGIQHQPRLVAVSKRCSVTAIKAAYDYGHRDFGENYVSEIVEKAPQLPSDIRWHFIGHLQSNKCAKLLRIPNISVIETVDSLHLAARLNSSITSHYPGREPLKVMVQVNTSHEEGKAGCLEAEAQSVARFVAQECPALRLAGFMTIGTLGSNENVKKEFLNLAAIRDSCAESLDVPVQDLELSMGMSADYELAIQFGSTNVRVGTRIFGRRLGSPVP